MKTITKDELALVLKKHVLWLDSKEGGERADLRGADLWGAYLEGADLWGAYLEGANLGGADLRGAYLEGANLRGAYLGGAYLGGADLEGATLPTGETFEVYLKEVVPQLLTSGGKTIAQILEAGSWECHEWTNCPMACAFSTNEIKDTPILLRPRVEQFIHFFDNGLIPKPT